jgi:branched-chain amino acid transport system substrate-binding protein
LPARAARTTSARNLLALVALALLLPLASACSGGGNSSVHIYSTIPLQGSSGADYQTVVDAIRMSLADHNGHAGPFAVTYTSLDDSTKARGEWDPVQESQNARRAVNDPNAVAVIGPMNSGAAKVSIPILNRVSMALVTPGSTYPGLTKTAAALPGEPYVYSPLGPGAINFCRTVTTDDLQGAAAALYAQQTLKAASVYIVDDTQLYGHGIAQVFEQKANAIGLKVLGHALADPTRTDYNDITQQIASANPSLVYYGGLAENHPDEILKELRAKGFKGAFMGADGIDDTGFGKSAGQSGGDVIATFVGLPPDQLQGAGKDWYMRYKQQHGGKDPGAYAAYGYEAMSVLLDAIAKAGANGKQPSPAQVLAALRAEKNFQGITGTWSFDQNCDTTLTTISVLKVQNGAFVYQGTAPQP